jgi:hypothetical protein
MKALILSIAFILLNSILYKANAQNVSQDLHASTGGSTTIDNVYISWSMGEVFTDKLMGENVSFTQGFHQPLNASSSPIDEILKNNNVRLFPNPTSDLLIVDSELSGIQEIRIYNVLGQQILTDKFESKKAFYLGKLRPAAYFVHISQGSEIKYITTFQKI